jgi:hypothetical protein
MSDMTDNIDKSLLPFVRERWGRLTDSQVAAVLCPANIAYFVAKAYDVTPFEADRQVRNWLLKMSLKP